VVVFQIYLIAVGQNPSGNDKVKLITQTGNQLREMMPWIGKSKIVNQDTN